MEVAYFMLAMTERLDSGSSFHFARNDLASSFLRVPVSYGFVNPRSTSGEKNKHR